MYKASHWINYKEAFEPSPNKLMYGNILIKGTKHSIRSVMLKVLESESFNSVVKSNPDISLSDVETCMKYAADLVGVIEFNKAMTAIDADRKQRQVIADRLESLKIKLPTDQSDTKEK